MNVSKKAIDDYNELLLSIYEDKDIVCLSDNDYSYKGRAVLSASANAIVRFVDSGFLKYLNKVTSDLKLRQHSDIYLRSEIITATADLKYRLGTLYLYLPYITKLKNSYGFHENIKNYYYEESVYDARFNRELPIAYECLYKYWQRLMDYVLYFFPKALKKCNGISYFDTIIKYIERNHGNLMTSENFKWILSFKENEYSLINRKRKFFVHSAGYDTEFFRSYIYAYKEESEIILLDTERSSHLEFIKNQLELCLEGYFKAMDFLCELKFTMNAGEENNLEYSLLKD